MPTIFINDKFIVAAVFLHWYDAKEFAKFTDNKYCALPFNVNNRENAKLPQVGDTYKV